MQNEIRETIFIFLNEGYKNSKIFTKKYKINATKVAEELNLDVRTARKYIKEYESENTLERRLSRKIDFLLSNLTDTEDITKVEAIREFYQMERVEFDYLAYDKLTKQYKNDLDDYLKKVSLKKKEALTTLNGALNDSISKLDLSNEYDLLHLQKLAKEILKIVDIE